MDLNSFTFEQATNIVNTKLPVKKKFAQKPKSHF